jgi:hypothetical protein
MGLPVGSDLEYADEVTMYKALYQPTRGLIMADDFIADFLALREANERLRQQPDQDVDLD